MNKPRCAKHTWGEWRKISIGRGVLYFRLCQTCHAVEVCPAWRYELIAATDAIKKAVRDVLHLDAIAAWLCKASWLRRSRR
jgi:hypothetical protein